MVREIQDFMWTEVGIVRSREGLRSAIGKLEELGAALGGPGGRRAYEALNLQQAGWLVARAAVAREESRGAHYRSDFPHHDDAHFLRHSVLVGDRVSFVADQ
jgi:L-aspartate oxidase